MFDGSVIIIQRFILISSLPMLRAGSRLGTTHHMHLRHLYLMRLFLNVLRSAYDGLVCNQPHSTSVDGH